MQDCEDIVFQCPYCKSEFAELPQNCPNCGCRRTMKRYKPGKSRTLVDKILVDDNYVILIDNNYVV